MSAAPHTTLRLSDVASAVGGTVVGDGEARVSGIASLDRATSNDLTFLASSKYSKLLIESAAGGVLVTPELAGAPGRCANRVIVAKPHEAMLALLPTFYRMPARPFVGVHPTAVVDPSARLDADSCVEAFCVIGADARIAKGAWIGPHCVLGEGVTVGADSRLVSQVTLYPGSAVGARVLLHAGVRIGSDGFGFVFQGGAHQKIPHVGRCLIGDDVEIGANSTIDRGSIDATEIGAGTKIDNLVHVGHNVRVGRLCLFAAGVGVAGSTRIGDGAIITAQSGVLKDVPAGETWGGFPSRPQRETLRGYAAVNKLPDLIKRLQGLLARDPEA